LSQLAQLINKGYDATKADAKIKVIVHLDEGNNNQKFRWFFDNAKANNVKYDVIGLSYYPFGSRKITQNYTNLAYNLNDMVYEI
jgi:arabinogalactan endo-1,4-beta-galactosidase